MRETVAAQGYIGHIRGRGEERQEPHPDGKARRVVVQWEKKVTNYLAFVQLACAQLLFSRLCSVFG